MAQMIPLEDYVSQVLEALSPLEGGRVPLGRAHGRVLAEDVTAAVPVPPWTNSAMDGYAVRAKDTTGACPQTRGRSGRRRTAAPRGGNRPADHDWGDAA